MKDYLIWAGEKLMKKTFRPNMWSYDWVWECVMNYCTTHELTGEYSIASYIAERGCI